MKKFSSNKGFTLVELMIVIAIIGILAAVLYPAMTGYFERSRDTNRKAALQQISLAVNTYFIDHEKYPEGGSETKCTSHIATLLAPSAAAASGGGASTATSGQTYMKSMPLDPQKTNVIDGCTNGDYGYGVIKNALDVEKAAFKLGARVEQKGNGNMLEAGYKSDNINAFNTAISTATANKSTLTAANAVSVYGIAQ